MGKISVVVGGQFGSEAKGAVAGYLASPEQNYDHQEGSTLVTCVRVGGPNAGHTVYGRCPQGCTDAHIKPRTDADFTTAHPWRLRHVPVAAVTNPNATLIIAAGSEVDFRVLNQEVTDLTSAGYNVAARLMIDQSATVLTQDHIDQETAAGMVGRLGSTAKGVGAARSARIWRTADTAKDVAIYGRWHLIDSGLVLADMLADGDHIVIEGTQGYGLGVNTQFYPQCTSGNARAIDFLAQSGLSPWASYVDVLDVWVVARTYPIRVAGNSGPLTGETSWEDLELPAERTTVTQKIRRVGEWDGDLVREAVRANGGGYSSNVRLALTMVDYKFPKAKGISRWNDLDGETREGVAKLIDSVYRQTRATVGLVGTSPTSIIDLR